MFTIYFLKRNGKIAYYYHGKFDMSIFGDFQQDYEQIFDFIVTEYDEYLERNIINYRVNTETKQLEQTQ